MVAVVGACVSTVALRWGRAVFPGLWLAAGFGVYDSRQQYVAQPVDAEFIEVIFGEVEFESAAETRDSSGQFLSAEAGQRRCGLLEVCSRNHLTIPVQTRLVGPTTIDSIGNFSPELFKAQQKVCHKCEIMGRAGQKKLALRGNLCVNRPGIRLGSGASLGHRPFYSLRIPASPLWSEG